MKLTRRQYLALSATSALSACSLGATKTSDGIGPNRGVVDSTMRGKQTCNNVEVPVSEKAARLATPDDFLGNGCDMMIDSFEGPYFTCVPGNGKSIAVDEPGQALTVAMRLVDKNCQPIPGGIVDIWACNATGHYSGYGTDPDEMPPMVRVILFGHLQPDLSARFCRGALKTDEDGIAEFDTVYPGYYYGQPIHVHMKAHVNGINLLTTQANFPEDINQRVMRTAPYSDPRPITRSTKSMGFPIMNVIERDDQLLATLDLVVPGT